MGAKVEPKQRNYCIGVAKRPFHVGIVGTGIGLLTGIPIVYVRCPYEGLCGAMHAVPNVCSLRPDVLLPGCKYHK